MSELHPLLNPVVLRRLFELSSFDLEEFRNYRQVSTAWLDPTLPVWRENAWLRVLDKDASLVVPELDTCEGPGMNLEEYVGLFGNNCELELTQLLYRRYLLERWNRSFGTEVKSTFWNRMGPLITHLNISSCILARTEDLRQILFRMTPNLKALRLCKNIYQTKRPLIRAHRLEPNLPQHTLKDTPVQRNLVELEVELLDGFSPTSNLPITWMELLLHFPNIQKFGPIRVGLAQPIDELREIFETVEILRREYGSGYLANVTDLDIMQEMRGRPRATLESLTRLHFPLRRLALNIGSFTEASVFKQLLETCMISLEYLNVTRGSPPPNDLAQFPNFPFGLKLPRIKELTFSGPVVRNLMFLKEFPNLEKFQYSPPNEARFEDNLKEVLRGAKETKLKKLNELCIISDGCSPAEIKKLGELMPNVRKLRIGLDNEGFRFVCETWGKLSHTEIVPFRVDDKGLLGKDVQGKKFSLPNITNLKDLKSFKMESIKNVGPCQGLTEEVILHGILASSNLEQVGLFLSSEVTNQVKEQLRGRFPRSKISTLEPSE